MRFLHFNFIHGIIEIWFFCVHSEHKHNDHRLTSICKLSRSPSFMMQSEAQTSNGTQTTPKAHCWPGKRRTQGTAEPKQHKSMLPRHLWLHNPSILGEACVSENATTATAAEPQRSGSSDWVGKRPACQSRDVTESIIQPVGLWQLGVGLRPWAPSCLCLFTGAGKSKMCLISEAVKVRPGTDQVSPMHPILPQQPLLTGYQSM